MFHRYHFYLKLKYNYVLNIEWLALINSFASSLCFGVVVNCKKKKIVFLKNIKIKIYNFICVSLQKKNSLKTVTEMLEKRFEN